MSQNKEYVFDTARTRCYRFPTHVNELVMDRADATTSEVFVVIIEPGKSPPMHVHDDTEQVFYVISGQGELAIQSCEARFPVGPGDVVRIPPSTHHLIKCTGVEPLKYIAVDCFVNGRPEDEPTWESHARVICDLNGWNIDKVRTRESG